ncbi:MAG: CbtB-domain containing protein [Mycobacteriales bacterium]
MSTKTQVAAQPIAKQGLAAVLTGIAVVLALVALYAVFLDQGQLLSPVMGKVAATANYLHELAHDGRHLLGAPCH